MRGAGNPDPELMDAAALVGHLVPTGSVFAFLAQHRREVFPPDLFEDLFPSTTGRPSVPIDIAASMLVLQTLTDLSDREAMQAVRCEVPGAAEIITARCHAHDYDDPGKPAIVWDDKAAREALVSGLVTDALAVVEALADAELEGTAAEAVALLALVAGQDVEPAEGSDGTDGRWRIARKVAPDRVISTVDPDARHVHKTVHHKQDGYKGHIAIEPDTGLFTGGRLTQASGVMRINEHIVRWAMQKFKRLRGQPARAWAWLDAVRQHRPRLFAHWYLLPFINSRSVGAG